MYTQELRSMSGMGEVFIKTVLSIRAATRGNRKRPRALTLKRVWAIRKQRDTVQAKKASDSLKPINGKNDRSKPRKTRKPV